MHSSLLSLAAALPGFVRFGHWQVPLFGLIASLGIVVALFVSQRTAPLAGLDPNRLWDAGIVAVLSAFVASRALLIAMNPRTFLHQPLLVLAQPSLTIADLLLTALVVWFWLRRQRLPFLQVADAWAVPGMLLAAMLQIAHFAEGTGLGMPTMLPWGVVPRGGHSIRLHPVQIYAAAAYLALAALLFRQQRQRSSHLPGKSAAFALAVGGMITFLAGFLRLPYDLLGHSWLDPGQWVGLCTVLTAAALWLLTVSSTPMDRLREAH